MKTIAAFALFLLMAAQALAHPLDALSAKEITAAVVALQDARAVDKDTKYPVITLLEPPKDEVLAWKADGPAPPRKAFVVFRLRNETYEAVVNITTGKVETQTKKPGAQPMIMDFEWTLARDRFIADPRYAKAIARRGLDPKSVFCTPVSAGYFPSEGLKGRRILKVPCYSREEKLHPTLARPIENLMGVVDTDTGEVIDVIDREIVALPPAPKGYGDDLPKPRKPLKPIEITARKGVNFTVKNSGEVSWLNWTFHVRGDRRAGAILSLARFDKRMIAYQMAVSELFVPYMDPDPTWSYKTYMDAGEFGLGYLISALKPGLDCPKEATFFDFTYHGDFGGSYVRKNALCIFERNTGDPGWRHYSSGKKVVDGRPGLELVVRFIPTLGNYDYVMDTVFSPAGSIKLRVGATGFDAIKSVASADMDSPTAEADMAYGGLIAPYTVAPNHDHYINYRLDLDIDGESNAFVRDLFKAEPTPGDLRKTHWVVKTQRYKTEGPIVPDHAATGGEMWRITNLNQKTALKYNPSFLIHGHHQPTSIMAPDDPAQLRAGFSANTIWVSTYKPGEYWAAGEYPNLSVTDEGIPKFVADGEEIVNKDLVIWYTMGFRHITRPEDFPILPTLWHEVELRPAFFFDRNPSFTLNPDFAK